ncbi:MAG: ribosome assembly factor SBDS [Candidatus Thermoplasmatota archaeon]|nr:ribosome assembly factor SBDS [Candidatus Thermoplasmatota archaeon]
MVKVEDSIVARYESHGHKFEILMDPDATERIKSGEFDIDSDLAIDQVFKDARKGDKAGDEILKEVFHTTDIMTVASEIAKKGQIQLTTDQRREMLEKRRKQIIEMIARDSINPQTNAPNPPGRIAQAMEDAKVHVDPFRSAEDQLQGVLKLIKPLVPIRFEKAKLAVRLRGDAYGRIYGDLVKTGFIQKEEWGKDGSWMGVLEIPAGIRTDFMESLSKKGKELIDIKILKSF